jgi:hypothetical protein
MKVMADKIASATRNAKVPSELSLSAEIISQEGYVIAGKLLTERGDYNTLELVSGRMSRLYKGDIIVGVLGPRNALKGFSGVVPASLAPGEVIQLLNLGGVLGKCTSENAELGRPIDVEVLGAVQHFPSFQHRVGRPASIDQGEIRPMDTLLASPPLIVISGTCMDAGKTRAACELVKHISRAGKKVAAAKLTGVSLMRDTLAMSDCGASQVLNFTDAGVVTSTPDNALKAAKGVIHALAAAAPDCIVLELGDGIMGEYGTMSLLSDAELMQFAKAHVLSANDPVGAWGAITFINGLPKGHPCPAVDIICGPSTDNDVGKNFIRSKLGVKAANSIRDGKELASVVFERVFGATLP